MKVAMLTTTGEGCGIAAYSRALVAALREFVEVQVEPIQVGRQPPEHYREQAARLNAAEVVHVQHEHSFWGGILPNRSAFWTLRYLIEKPFVITAHTTLSLAEMLRVKEERRPLRRLAKQLLLLRRGYRDSVEIAPFVTRGECIVHTEAGRRALIERGADPQHLHVIPAGVPDVFKDEGGRMKDEENGQALHPSSFILHPSEAFRERFALGDRRILSLFGYIAPNKGYELTLRILPELPPDVALVIAGGPRTAEMEPYAQSVRKLIAEAGLQERVVITGFLTEEEIAGAMAASEVVLAPHTQATGSYSIMVPLSYGRPIVASDLDCFKEIQERVPCMRLFRSGDAGHFAACLKGVLNNPVGRQEMSERALRYATENTWRRAAERTVAVYEKALAGRMKDEG
jgi:glycosyltransferase involved in cell wall biosynthesis